MKKVRMAIVGYGNLGKGVEKTLLKREDVEIVGVFTRRDPKSLKTIFAPVFSYETLFDYKDKIDVCILCGGSLHDLPIQTPEISKIFNTVDSYDNHKLIREHQENVQKEIKYTTAIISVGWDPGLFSMQRLLAHAILGQSETFWGEGVSQGHSDALRQLEGVQDAIQVTVPSKEAILKAQKGYTNLKNKHKRVCYVVSDCKDKEQLTHEIKTMPHYFASFETEVNYVSQEELNTMFPSMPHGGFVIGSDGFSSMEFSLKLNSNPDFTAQVLVAYAYASYRMNQDNLFGSYTIFDVAIKYLLPNYYDIL